MVRPRYLLYCSHFMARWGERMWEFAVALLLLDVVSDSIFLVGAYGFGEALVTMLGGAQVGRWIDTTDRLVVVRNFLLAQNLAIAASAACILSVFHFKPGPALHAILVVGTIVAGSLSMLARVGSGVALEKDWVVVIAKGDKKALAGMNAVMRRIDLTCKILAPAAVGVIVAYSAQIGALIIAAWNVSVFYFEYILVRSAYNSEPLLQVKNDDDDDAADAAAHPGVIAGMFRKVTMVCKGWTAYKRQSVAWAAWGLALLYFTVLSFGILMTAYLKWAGMPQSILGAARGVGAGFGVTATFVYPILHERIGLKATGMVSIVLEFLCLLPCVLSALYALGTHSVGTEWFHGELGSFPDTKGADGAGTVPWSALILMMGGVVSARFGLWMYDLTVSQMLQELVPAKERGLVNGFQQAVQSLFTMGVFVVGMIDHKPINFGWLTLLSLFMVFLAVLSYIVFVCTTRRRVGDGERKGLLESARERAQAKEALRNGNHIDSGPAVVSRNDADPDSETASAGPAGAGTGAAPASNGAQASFVAIYDDESDGSATESRGPTPAVGSGSTGGR